MMVMCTCHWSVINLGKDQHSQIKKRGHFTIYQLLTMRKMSASIILKAAEFFHGNFVI